MLHALQPLVPDVALTLPRLSQTLTDTWLTVSYTDIDTLANETREINNHTN